MAEAYCSRVWGLGFDSLCDVLIKMKSSSGFSVDAESLGSADENQNKKIQVKKYIFLK